MSLDPKREGTAKKKISAGAPMVVAVPAHAGDRGAPLVALSGGWEGEGGTRHATVIAACRMYATTAPGFEPA